MRFGGEWKAGRIMLRRLQVARSLAREPHATPPRRSWFDKSGRSRLTGCLPLQASEGDAKLMTKLTCSVCGGTTFTDRKVLWIGLVSECKLAPHEHPYAAQAAWMFWGIARRQTVFLCDGCSASLI